MILSLSLVGSQAFAAEDHWPIKEGESSPAAGQCMTTERSVQLGFWASQCKERIAIEVARVQRLGEIDVGLCNQQNAIASETSAAKIKVLEDQIAKGYDWKVHPAIWFGVGVLVTVTAVLVSRETIIGAP